MFATRNTRQAVGRAVLVATLDLHSANPWPRLPGSEFRSLTGLRGALGALLWAAPEARVALLPPLSDAALEAMRAVAGGAPPAARGGGPRA